MMNSRGCGIRRTLNSLPLVVAIAACAAFGPRAEPIRVLVYTTPPLGDPLDVVGPLRATLYVSSSAADTVKLVDVHPDSRAFNVQEGILRAYYREGFDRTVWMRPREVYEVEVDLHVTAHRFLAGHRVRVEVSSSNFPRFDRNLNMGGDNVTETKWRTAENAIHHSPAHPSHLLLPVVAGGGEASVMGVDSAGSPRRREFARGTGPASSPHWSRALSTSAEAQERAHGDTLPRFESSECPFDTSSIDVKGLRCGYLTVPENREKDDGRTIRLAVAIAEPSGATEDPVVLLPGGPGGGPLPRWIAGIRQWIPSDRTLVVFDPRGTGYSGPVMCPELNETQSAIAALDLSIEEERLLRRGADLACRDVLLRQGIDLGAYNSTTVALDLIDLRRALGYAQWNLMSASYGVPFARAAMRLDPEGIRSAILAIGNPPDLTDLLRRDVPFRARALGRVFQGCATEPACRVLYTDLEDAFYRVGASLRAEPLTVPVDPERFRSATFTVNSQDYLAMIGGMLPSESDVPHIPALIRAFDRRDVDVVRKVVERHYGGLSSNWSFGMANSVMCYDAHTARSRAEWHEAAASFPSELAEVVEWLQPCEDWHEERASEEERRPHHSSIPALVISGEFDPTSNPVVGEEQLRWLPNGLHIVIPGMGHMPTSRSAACWGSLIGQFVAEPGRRPDESCTDVLPRVRIGPHLPEWAQPENADELR